MREILLFVQTTKSAKRRKIHQEKLLILCRRVDQEFEFLKS